MTLDKLPQLSGHRFLHPHNGEDNICPTGLLRGSKGDNQGRFAPYCGHTQNLLSGGPEGHEKFCVILKEELLEGPGPGLQKRHMARRLWLPFFLGFQALSAHEASLRPRPHYPASWGSCTVIVSLPWCGAETREHGKFFPSPLHQSNPSKPLSQPGTMDP